MIRGLFLSLCLILVAACSPPPETVTTQTSAAATAIAAAWTRTATPTLTSTATLTSKGTSTATPTATATTSLPTSTAIGLVYIPNATIVYYDISGSSAGELRAQLDALGPVGYDGYKGDATTKWFIRWNWPGYGSSSCDLSKATVSYEIQVVFPHWTPPDNASPDLVTKWINYTRALAEHEKGHVDYVVTNYQSVLDAIKSATCETADAAATSALEPIRQHDIDYDAATNHGQTQGARFP